MTPIYCILLVALIALVVIIALVVAAGTTTMPATSVKGGAPPGPEMFIQEPWYSFVKDGRKDVEGRAAKKGRWAGHIGETLTIRTRPGATEAVRARITGVRHYDTLDEYLDAEWQRAAPHCATKGEAREAYLAVTMRKGVQVFGESRVRERGGMEAIELETLS